MSLLGIWRDVFLFSDAATPSRASSTSTRTGIRSWRSGSLGLGVDVINLDLGTRGPTTSRSTVRGDGGDDQSIARAGSGSVDGVGRRREAFASGRWPSRPGPPKGPISTTSRSSSPPTAGPPSSLPPPDRVPAGGDPRQPAARQRGTDPDSRRQPARLPDPQGPGAVRRGHAGRCRQPAPGQRQRHPDLALSTEPASPRGVCDEVGMFVFEQPPICFSGRVRRPPLDPHERGRPADPVSPRRHGRDGRPATRGTPR